MSAQRTEDPAVRERLSAIFDQQPARRAAWDSPAPFAPEQASAPAAIASGVVPPPAVAGEVEGEAVRPGVAGPKQAVGARTPAVLGKAWSFTRSHLGAVGLVLLTGCLWAGYSISQAQSSEIPIVAPTVQSAPTEAPPPSATPAPMVAVHVLGGVKSPGVVSVESGARVRDVIAAAGGLSADGDAAELNLAAPALDGSQIVIGTRDSPRGEVRASGSGSVAGSTGKVSVNTATAAQLESVPGIGPVTAQRIIAWREAHQRFSALEELQEIEGIGAKTFASLSGYLEL
ncbi:MAG: ComEA family DNA-binding protein [Propionibacteriaceae bacterium]|nr:ComEA family DNA-binding protein [Propionibacteriaceae bacterium]